MKLNSLFFLYFIFLSGALNSQIRNGSFEQNQGLPNDIGQYNLVKFWGNCNSDSATPDYYHVDGINGGDLPTTPAAIINPNNGLSIIGLLLYHHESSNVREYLSTKFTSPLIIGEEYFISFRISSGVVLPTSNAGYGINKIGILLSTTEITQVGDAPILETPQFEVDTVLYSREWQTINFKIKPTQNFEFLTVGVFRSDDQLIINKNEPNAKMAYYFIDNFRIRNSSLPEVVKDDPETIPPIIEEPGTVSDSNFPYFIPNTFTPNNDGENDFFIPVINTQEDFVFEVYSRWGELIYSTTIKNVGWDGTYQGKPMDQGVFIWTLRYKTYEGEDQVEKQFHGQINLLR